MLPAKAAGLPDRVGNHGLALRRVRTSAYTYRSYRPERAHPLDNAGMPNSMMLDHQSTVITNEYVEELPCLIDERTAALAEIERSMRLLDAHPGMWNL